MTCCRWRVCGRRFPLCDIECLDKVRWEPVDCTEDRASFFLDTSMGQDVEKYSSHGLEMQLQS